MKTANSNDTTIIQGSLDTSLSTCVAQKFGGSKLRWINCCQKDFGIKTSVGYIISCLAQQVRICWWTKNGRLVMNHQSFYCQ